MRDRRGRRMVGVDVRPPGAHRYQRNEDEHGLQPEMDGRGKAAQRFREPPPHKAAHRMAHRRQAMSRADALSGDVTVTAKA